MPTTIDENSGRCITRPRRALNQSSRPRTANASGVVASATRAAGTPAPGTGRSPARHDTVSKDLSGSSCPRRRSRWKTDSGCHGRQGGRARRGSGVQHSSNRPTAIIAAAGRPRQRSRPGSIRPRAFQHGGMVRRFGSREQRLDKGIGVKRLQVVQGFADVNPRNHRPLVTAAGTYRSDPRHGGSARCGMIQVQDAMVIHPTGAFPIPRQPSRRNAQMPVPEVSLMIAAVAGVAWSQPLIPVSTPRIDFGPESPQGQQIRCSLAQTISNPPFSVLLPSLPFVPLTVIG